MAYPDRANTIHAWGKAHQTACERSSVTRVMVPAFVLWHMKPDRPACTDCLWALAQMYRGTVTA